jgi:hypothetical protein
MTLQFRDGRALTHEIELLPSARATIPIGAVFPEALGKHFSVVMESLGVSRVPLIVECARYCRDQAKCLA